MKHLVIKLLSRWEIKTDQIHVKGTNFTRKLTAEKFTLNKNADIRGGTCERVSMSDFKH